MKNNKKTWSNILIIIDFLTVWLGIPFLLVKMSDRYMWAVLIFITWLPAVLLVEYLNDDSDDDDFMNYN